MSFADLEARLGAVTLKRMANATVSIDGAPAVSCVYTSESDTARLGEHGYQARDLVVELAVGDAGAAAEGSLISLTYRGATRSLQVRERLPDDVHLGRASLLLEEVPA